MIKLLTIATKRADLTSDAFVTYWRLIHAPLVARMPGLRRYVINPVVTDDSMTNAKCDGIDEMWFDNFIALKEAAGSEPGKRAFADLPNFCSLATATVVTEELEVVDRSSIAGGAL